MTTVALIRTTYLNGILGVNADADAVPWAQARRTQAITDAFTALWQDGSGKRAQGTVATSQASDVYTIPAILQPGRVSRIELERTAGGVTQRIQRATHWEYYSDTQVRIEPLLPTDSSLSLRFFGWAPWDVTGSDLPTRLEPAVAYKAAALLYGEEAAYLANSQRQQGLDSGRVVDYQTAVGMSAYWERRYRDLLDGDQSIRSYASRHAHRS